MKSEAERCAAQWGIPIIIALMAVAVRLVVRADKLTLAGIVRGVVIGLFVGAIVNLALTDATSLSDAERGAIIGVAVVVAEDLIAALLAIGSQIKNQPEKLIQLFLRGKK